MSKLFRVLPFAFFAAPLLVHALPFDLFEVFDFLISLVSEIVPLLVAIAVLVFFWGIVKFISHAGDEKTHEEGKQFMIWGMIALFVMVALWSIVGYFQETLGLTSWGSLGDLPTVPDTIPTP